MEEINNTDRAVWASAALDTFLKVSGKDDATDASEDILNLMVDLLHLSRISECDPHEIWVQVYDLFLDEDKE